MPISLLNKKIWAERIIAIGSPSVVIPPLRYMYDVDKPKEIRNEILARDVIGYGIGGGIILGVLKGLEKFKKIKRVPAIALATLCGSTWCGVVAPKITKESEELISKASGCRLDFHN